MSTSCFWWIFAILLYSSRASIFDAIPTLDILHESTCSEDHLNLRWTFTDSNLLSQYKSILLPSMNPSLWAHAFASVSPQIFEYRVLKSYSFKQTAIIHHEVLPYKNAIHSVHIFLDECNWNQDFEFRIGFAHDGECRWTGVYSTSMQFMLSNCMTSKNEDLPSEWMSRAPLYVAIGVGTAAAAATALPILGFTTGTLADFVSAERLIRITFDSASV